MWYTPVAVGSGGHVAADEAFGAGAQFVEAVVEAAARHIAALHEAQSRPAHALAVNPHAAQARGALTARTRAAPRA